MDTASLDRISFLIIQAAIEIHKALGPGLLESTYRPCMIYELTERNLKVTSELSVPVRYKHLVLDGLAHQFQCGESRSGRRSNREQIWVARLVALQIGGHPYRHNVVRRKCLCVFAALRQDRRLTSTTYCVSSLIIAAR